MLLVRVAIFVAFLQQFVAFLQQILKNEFYHKNATNCCKNATKIATPTNNMFLQLHFRGIVFKLLLGISTEC